MNERPKRKRVLSGTQPSGVLHLGNYFGALRQHVALQQENAATYFIADLHSLNSVRDAKQLREYTRGVALDYLALGLDPDRTNVDGGAIALTHPLAASGARITIHLLHELRRRGARYGLGSACIGGGQGGAVIVEAL